jgi:hypothetical protein
VCRGEAPGVEQFARENIDQVEVVGLGTQDSLDEAFDFVSDYGTESFAMLWDESFESWTALDISGQPTVVLFGSDGTELGRWSGGIPEDEVLSLIADA